jgi:serine/threonine protein phosphatase 1
VSRRLVVSDPHGELERLIDALCKADYAPGYDRLFLLGDYIDRGHNPKGTLQYVRRLQEEDGAVVLKGNHEDMLVGVMDGPYDLEWWIRNGGLHTLKSYNMNIPEGVVEWCRNLPLYHEEEDYILVHAGIRPGVPMEQQKQDDLLWIREEFYEHYNGPKPVVFGHTPTYFFTGGEARPLIEPHLIAIDTGAVFDGLLTVMDLDSKECFTA